MNIPTIEALGDQAVLLRWGDVAELDINRRVHALARRLRVVRAPWLLDCVPAYASLAIFFDGATIPGGDPMAVVGDFLRKMLDEPESEPAEVEPRLIEIPVCYGGEHGPDLDDVASACGMSTAQVVEKHSQPEYLVAMLGFSPGFPYLLGLDSELATPRLATPRVRVPAGSVGIGGAQTGVYPDEGPGGWRLIGRTPQSMFDPGRESPAHVSPGDRVRFVPIDEARFQKLHERKT